jgi:hypothetical protein
MIIKDFYLKQDEQMPDARSRSNHGRFNPDKPTGWRRYYRGYEIFDIGF